VHCTGDSSGCTSPASINYSLHQVDMCTIVGIRDQNFFSRASPQSAAYSLPVWAVPIFAWRRMRIFHIVPIGGDHCDFCNAPTVVKLYDCKNFEWENQPIFRGGCAATVRAWTACEKCAALIDAEQWDSLTERALRHFRRKHAIPRSSTPAIRKQLHQIHLLFREHRIKPC